VLACCQRRRKHGPAYKYLEWNANGTLQLQRLAYQGLESGEWGGYEDDVPTTKGWGPLADLTAAYPNQDEEEARREKRNSSDATTSTPLINDAEETSQVTVSPEARSQTEAEGTSEDARDRDAPENLPAIASSTTAPSTPPDPVSPAPPSPPSPTVSTKAKRTSSICQGQESEQAQGHQIQDAVSSVESTSLPNNGWIEMAIEPVHEPGHPRRVQTTTEHRHTK
jgi:hypothetical protein